MPNSVALVPVDDYFKALLQGAGEDNVHAQVFWLPAVEMKTHMIPNILRAATEFSPAHTMLCIVGDALCKQ